VIETYKTTDLCEAGYPSCRDKKSLRVIETESTVDLVTQCDFVAEIRRAFG